MPIPRYILLWRTMTARPFNWVAMVMAALFSIAASVWLVPGGRGIVGAGLAVLMILIAAVDARFFIIPNELTALASLLGLVHAAIGDPDAITGSLVGAAFRGIGLFLFFWGFSATYRWLRRRDGIGFGDVKLSGVAGIWLAWLTIPIVIEIAAITALFAYLVRQFVLGRAPRSSNRLPFGLFLAPAIWIGWLIEATVLLPSSVLSY